MKNNLKHIILSSLIIVIILTNLCACQKKNLTSFEEVKEYVTETVTLDYSNLLKNAKSDKEKEDIQKTIDTESNKITNFIYEIGINSGEIIDEGSIKSLMKDYNLSKESATIILKYLREKDNKTAFIDDLSVVDILKYFDNDDLFNYIIYAIGINLENYSEEEIESYASKIVTLIETDGIKATIEGLGGALSDYIVCANDMNFEENSDIYDWIFKSDWITDDTIFKNGSVTIGKVKPFVFDNSLYIIYLDNIVLKDVECNYTISYNYLEGKTEEDISSYDENFWNNLQNTITVNTKQNNEYSDWLSEYPIVDDTATITTENGCIAAKIIDVEIVDVITKLKNSIKNKVTKEWLSETYSSSNVKEN